MKIELARKFSARRSSSCWWASVRGWGSRKASHCYAVYSPRVAYRRGDRDAAYFSIHQGDAAGRKLPAVIVDLAKTDAGQKASGINMTR
ncbi:hypothetical protein KCP71_13995 [Salmonella enterica subsp. enterica]|nr:hypothetical protein KCP71_13995 [Salmonella enterica subsp. enterica]